MSAVSVPIHGKEQQLRADNSRQHGNDPEIPHLIGIDARAPAKPHGDYESQHQAQSGQHSVGGQKEVSELSKSGEQSFLRTVYQRKGSGRKNKPTRGAVPTGPFLNPSLDVWELAAVL